MIKVFGRGSYYLLATLLFIIEAIHLQKREWVGDFWEHSAAINELAKHPFHPSHPMLNVPVTHVFFSPYSLLVASFSRVFGINTIDALMVFAYGNLIVLLCCFYFFCRNLFTNHYRIIASLSLIFILFFWGSNPFLWSGFYHIFVLNYILPYPSTFSLGLSFFILGLVAKKRPGLNFSTFIVIFLSSIVFLSHPYTGVFLWLCIFGLVFIYYEVSFQQSCKYFMMLSIPFLLLCLQWPYYNFTKLFVDSNSDFHHISLQLYDRIIGLNWPAVVAVSGYFMVKRDKAYDFLIFSLLGLGIIYGVSYVFSLYGLSRVISNVMIVGHILLAYTLVLISKNQIKWKHSVYLIFVFILFSLSLLRNQPQLRKVFSFSKKVDTNYYQRYEFLRSFIPADALVLSDEMSNWYIPTFSGKVVSSAHPLFMINDNLDRRNEVDLFFNPESKELDREKIIAKYQPAYLLIDMKRNKLSDSTMEWIKSQAIKKYEKDELLLFEMIRKNENN